WLSKRHVRPDKARCSIDAGHAGAPVVRLGSPKRGKSHLAVFLPRALSIRTMAQCAILLIDRQASAYVVVVLWLRHLGIERSARLVASRQPVGHPGHVSHEIAVHVAASRWRLSR